MKEVIHSFREFDRFLKDQLLIGLFTQCTWALVVPLIHKLQGMLWTTTYISVYLILIRMSGMFVPYFKGVHLKKTYAAIIMLNMLYVAGTSLYFIDQNYFLWVEVFLSILFCINSQLLGIAWDIYIVDKYSKNIFEDYKYCAAIRDSFGGVGGYSIVILLYSFLNQKESMLLFISLMIIVLSLQIYNYIIHYSNMK